MDKFANMIRLPVNEIEAIQTAFAEQKCTGCELYLFGSRTRPNAKGGDIDLVIVQTTDNKEIKFDRLRFLVDIKRKIGERRIDVSTVDMATTKVDPFWMSVMPNAVKLSV